MRERRLIRDILRAPRQFALCLTFGYLGFTAAWIYFSAEWAQALSSGDVEIFKKISQYQDFLFLGMKAIGIYFFSHLIFRKVATSARTLMLSEELRSEAERKAIPALLAGSVAHDVANLLTVLRLNIERLKQLEASCPETTTAIGKLDKSTDRLTELVQRLRGASKNLFRDRPQLFNFATTVQDTIEMMELHTSIGTAEVDYVGPDALYLRGYPVLIHQLVMNLILNAAEAMGGKGKIHFSAESLENGIRLVAEDEGPGIPVNLRQIILGPFFTTKATGSGLGLISVRTCVEMHQGTLEIGDSATGGARFALTLPNLEDERIEELRNPERRAPFERALENAEA